MTKRPQPAILPLHIANHLRDVHTGGNWTCVNLHEQLADVTYGQATTSVYGLNTLAALTYHVHYYVDAVLKVLHGQPLSSKDAESFSHPPLHSQADWEAMRDKALADAETLATLIEHLPEHQLWETFTDPKYGNYYRNLQGIIEHTHYYLGQIVVIKRIISQLQQPDLPQ